MALTESFMYMVKESSEERKLLKKPVEIAYGMPC